MRNRLNNSIDSSQLANVTENRPLSLSKKASVYTISGGNEDWHSQNETNKELKRLSDNYEKKNKELQK